MITPVDPKDTDSFLAHFRGAKASIWFYSVRHGRFLLRLYRADENNHIKEVLCIISLGTHSMRGRFHWDNANISIFPEKIGKEEYVTKMVDHNADFELVSNGNIVLFTGSPEDVDAYFHRFLGDKIE
jgi:hypothetical protein